MMGYWLGIRNPPFHNNDNLSVARDAATTTNNNNNHNPNNNKADEEKGWHDIHVYYGNQDQLPILVERDAGSQFGQDEIVLQLLNGKTDGYFVDLAAHDATFYSNTYRLEGVSHDNSNPAATLRPHLAWRGLCIEANPRYWRSLSYRHCQVIGAAVGKEDMEEVQFAIGEVGGWEGIAKEGFDNDIEKSKTERLRQKNQLHKYYTVSLETILTKFDAPRHIDYLSLDVEGAETFVMSSFPFDRYQISVVTVERPKQDLIELLAAHNYTRRCVVHTGSGETLFTNNNNVALNFSAVTHPACRTSAAAAATMTIPRPPIAQYYPQQQISQARINHVRASSTRTKRPQQQQSERETGQQ